MSKWLDCVVRRYKGVPAQDIFNAITSTHMKHSGIYSVFFWHISELLYGRLPFFKVVSVTSFLDKLVLMCKWFVALKISRMAPV